MRHGRRQIFPPTGGGSASGSRRKTVVHIFPPPEGLISARRVTRPVETEMLAISQRADGGVGLSHEGRFAVLSHRRMSFWDKSKKFPASQPD